MFCQCFHQPCSCILPPSISSQIISYLERVELEGLGKTGESLVPGTGLCDDGEAGDGAGNISAGELDALRITGLVGKGAGGRSGEAAVLLLPGAADSALGVATEGGAREHGDGGLSMATGEVCGCNGRWSSFAGDVEERCFLGLRTGSSRCGQSSRFGLLAGAAASGANAGEAGGGHQPQCAARR